MMQNVLILGASGTIGKAVFQVLSREPNLHPVGTYCFAAQKDDPSLLRFSLENPKEIRSVLAKVQPEVIVSALRGDFERQLIAHEYAARYLKSSGGRMIYLSSVNVFDACFHQPHYEGDVRVAKSDYGRFKIQCEDMLRSRLGNQAVLIRMPFVWGRQSPRFQEVMAGCESGQLNVYAPFLGNHAADIQVAEMIRWIIRREKNGIFHIGTIDVIRYADFVNKLASAAGGKPPRFVLQEGPGFMAAVSSRKDIPEVFRWTTGKLIRYLCCGAQGQKSPYPSSAKQ